MKLRQGFTFLLVFLMVVLTPSSFAEAKVFNRGNPDIKEMALTFDDGYSVEKIRQIMAKLNKHNVKGTFFFVGSFMASNKEIVNELEANGHMVVSHSFSHKNFVKSSDKVIVGEIENTKIAYHKATNKNMLPYVRPPYGAYDDRVLATLGKNHDLYVVMWTIDTQDWKGVSPSQINDNVFKNAGNGKIVLMHTTKHVQTDQALDDMIIGLKARGYGLVRIDEMFAKLPDPKRLPSIDTVYQESISLSQEAISGPVGPVDPDAPDAKSKEEAEDSPLDDSKEKNVSSSYDGPSDKIALDRAIEKLQKKQNLMSRYLWRLILSR